LEVLEEVKIEKGNELPVIHFGNYEGTFYVDSCSDSYITIDDDIYPMNFWVGDGGIATFENSNLV
jgi:hypothetical protein